MTLGIYAGTALNVRGHPTGGRRLMSESRDHQLLLISHMITSCEKDRTWRGSY